MRPARMLCLVALMLTLPALEAAAQTRSCVAKTESGRRPLSASALFESTWNWRGVPPDTPVLPMVPARRDHPAAAEASVTDVQFTTDLLTRMLPGVKDPNRLTFIAAANPDGPSRLDTSKETDPDNKHPEAQGILVTATQANAEAVRLRLSTPPIRTAYFPTQAEDSLGGRRCRVAGAPSSPSATATPTPCSASPPSPRRCARTSSGRS